MAVTSGPHRSRNLQHSSARYQSQAGAQQAPNAADYLAEHCISLGNAGRTELQQEINVAWLARSGSA